MPDVDRKKEGFYVKELFKGAPCAAIRCRTATALLLALVAIVWAGSMCSASVGEVKIRAYIRPLMELIIEEHNIEWDGLVVGENVCPSPLRYAVLSNMPFRVTIESDNPHMTVMDPGPMKGLMLKNPLEWCRDLSRDFTPISNQPATVFADNCSSPSIVQSIDLRQCIDVGDLPPIDATQCYRTTITLLLEPTV